MEEVEVSCNPLQIYFFCPKKLLPNFFHQLQKNESFLYDVGYNLKNWCGKVQDSDVSLHKYFVKMIYLMIIENKTWVYNYESLLILQNRQKKVSSCLVIVNLLIEVQWPKLYPPLSFSQLDHLSSSTKTFFLMIFNLLRAVQWPKLFLYSSLSRSLNWLDHVSSSTKTFRLMIFNLLRESSTMTRIIRTPSWLSL